MNFKSAIFKYKKIIMLALVFVAVIICVVATYVTEYNVNKIHVEELFTVEETRKYRSSSDFLDFFETFTITETTVIDPFTDEDGEPNPGSRTYTVVTKVKENTETEIKRVSLKLCLAADWIHYISKIGSSSTNMTLDRDNIISISDIDTRFPAAGNLWFVTVKEPTLYVLASWSENNTHYYTYLQYEHSEYSSK